MSLLWLILASVCVQVELKTLQERLDIDKQHWEENYKKKEVCYVHVWVQWRVEVRITAAGSCSRGPVWSFGCSSSKYKRQMSGGNVSFHYEWQSKRLAGVRLSGG